LALVIDASVGLKWVLQEADSGHARALIRLERDLLAPDFWLNEAANVLWLQVRKGVFTPDEARAGLGLLRAQVAVTPTRDMRLHEMALEIAFATGCAVYDALYVAFAVAMGASAVVAADAPFERAVRTHPDTALASMVLSLEAWAKSRDVRP
jgi:predicted nucleic acid-binding protein